MNSLTDIIGRIEWEAHRSHPKRFAIPFDEAYFFIEIKKLYACQSPDNLRGYVYGILTLFINTEFLSYKSKARAALEIYSFVEKIHPENPLK